MADASGATISVARQCQTIAAQLNSYAANIDRVHAAILDLLSRICDPLTGIKEVWDLLTDEDEDEIKRIADDIKTVVDSFSQEVEALGDQINATMSAAATATEDMAHWADKEWDHFLHGTLVGKALNQVGQVGKGVGVEGWDLLKGLYDISQFHAILDPKGYGETMSGMVAGAGALVGLGPDGGPGVAESWKALGKDITHWDEWSKNPAEALGKSIFDVATLALPGGPLSKLGKVGHGAADALKGFEKPSELPKPPSVKPAADPAPAGPKPPESGHPALTPQGKPGPSGKPAPGPADGPLPHSPTESKPAPVEKSPAAEPPKPAAAPAEPGGKTPAPAPPGGTPIPHSKSPETVPAHAPATPVEPAPASHAGPPPGSAPATPPAPHLPGPPSAPVGGGIPAGAAPGRGELPHGGEPPTHPGGPHGGDPHPPGDGGPHHSGDGHEPPGSHPPHDGTPHRPGEGGPHGLSDGVPNDPTGHGPHDPSPDDGSDHHLPLHALDSDDLAALAHYTGPGYQEMNSALREGALDASQQARVDALHKALEKLPMYEGTVVRGTNLPADVLEQYRPGEIITESAFTSTSTDHAVAQSPIFAGNTEFRIWSTTGRDVSSVSMFPDEQEILFPAGSKFYVVSKIVDPPTGRTIIEMIER
ncbi:ADP-ribosyltransferase [Mycobacterium arosiense]|uniref:ADP-ribosyltransferase n=1 Tax=Mycobacterium arosiense TaxID=425468 RepID=UPI001FE7B63F|nr:ADP-ribosyltransferase [Mycobacterium arosiense]